MNSARPLVFVLACFLSTPALAGDREAISHYNEALKHWNDPKPATALAAAEKALAQARSKNIRLNVLLLLGRLHSAKTGDSDSALGYYEQIIEAVSIHQRDKRYWSLKGDALLSKGNILVADKDDIPGGLKAFNASYDLMPSAANTNVLSQLMLRTARDEGKEEAKIRADLEKALNYAKEAVAYQRTARKKNPALLAKYSLQLVLVLKVMKRGDDAKAAWEKIDKEALDDNSSYEIAQHAALEGKDAAEVGKKLNAAMDLRPTPQTRNLLRKWVRDDPFFKPYLKDAGWKTLVTDE